MKKDRLSSVIVDAREVISLLLLEQGLSIVVSVSDYKTADSKVIKNNEDLHEYLYRLNHTDHVTHLKKDGDKIYLDIKRGGALKEYDKIIEALSLTGERGYHGIYTLDKEGIQKFYEAMLHPDDVTLAAYGFKRDAFSSKVNGEHSCSV